MSEDRLSVVIAGLGSAMLHACAASFDPLCADNIFVIDKVGNAQLGLIPSFPWQFGCRILLNENYDNWNLTNQTLNIGMEAARGRWVLCTHEDTFWNGYPFITEYERVIDVLEAQDNKIDGHEVVSVYFPFTQRGGGAHEPGKDVPTLGACYSAVSSIIRKDWWEEIGRFDEEHGIFYDYQVTAEMVKRGAFGYVHPLPGPLPYHERSVNYSAMQTAPGRANPGGFLERIEKWDLHRTFADVYGGGLGWHDWMRANEKRYECERL